MPYPLHDDINIKHLAVIRIGKTHDELAGPGDHFEQMAREPGFVEVFNGAMANLTGLVTPDVLSACQFTGVRRLMDVGGGVGELLVAILTAPSPAMCGIVFDLPRCAEGATRQIKDAAIGERCEFIARDFFKDIPTGADAIILKSVIRWHRTGFRLYWRWNSRSRGGRSKVPMEIRRLIREPG